MIVSAKSKCITFNVTTQEAMFKLRIAVTVRLCVCAYIMYMYMYIGQHNTKNKNEYCCIFYMLYKHESVSSRTCNIYINV